MQLWKLYLERGYVCPIVFNRARPLSDALRGEIVRKSSCLVARTEAWQSELPGFCSPPAGRRKTVVLQLEKGMGHQESCNLFVTLLLSCSVTLDK